MHKTALLCPVAAALLLLTPTAHALYKVIGPDGKVTYTDRPPSAGEGHVLPANSDGARSSEPGLPFALRQVASRFPVTLFTTGRCGEACALARNLLARRGIPFAERTAETDDEREAWIKLVGGVEAPALKVGEQVLRGFAPTAWEETLDTAGYPRQSLLPPNYATPRPTPLIERRPVPPPKPQAPPAAPAADPASNPAGIRF